MEGYVIPILIFLAIGSLVGLTLTQLSKIFQVQIDDRIEKVAAHLPGINCGACGFSGCESYAEAVVSKKAEPNLCKPGGLKTITGISNELGIEIKVPDREVAYVHCRGDCEATGDKFKYNGTRTCFATKRYYNGKGHCRFGCSGFGDCVKVCDFHAIEVKNGVAVINDSLCTACGLCIKECANKIISFRKIPEIVQVACQSEDKGKATKLACKNGCIACKICEKKCPSDAIHIGSENVAVIDYVKCTNCKICVDVCPVKCIIALPECRNIK